ncbi:MAG TPA: hypothetical protein VM935_08105 [Chitinophagaceae bacterium]|nr:hypothetical protein [Chitinophagaceae bacterium]
MMKGILFGSLLSMVLQVSDCKSPGKLSTCYKGRLEIKGLCSNYTIKILEGNMDTALKMKSWVDDQTGKTHTDVFALANPCSFPDDIEEGDEFYFAISTGKEEKCNVCMAYYPVPQKRVSISVLQKPCTQ